MPDATLDWLMENDPEAQGRSRRDYGHRAGVLTPQDESDIREHEITFTDLDHLRRHCSCCFRRYETGVNTVE